MDVRTGDLDGVQRCLADMQRIISPVREQGDMRVCGQSDALKDVLTWIDQEIRAIERNRPSRDQVKQRKEHEARLAPLRRLKRRAEEGYAAAVKKFDGSRAA